MGETDGRMPEQVAVVNMAASIMALWTAGPEDGRLQVNLNAGMYIGPDKMTKGNIYIYTKVAPPFGPALKLHTHGFAMGPMAHLSPCRHIFPVQTSGPLAEVPAVTKQSCAWP